jgi:hypothetical protein
MRRLDIVVAARGSVQTYALATPDVLDVEEEPLTMIESPAH